MQSKDTTEENLTHIREISRNGSDRAFQLISLFEIRQDALEFGSRVCQQGEEIIESTRQYGDNG